MPVLSYTDFDTLISAGCSWFWGVFMEFWPYLIPLFVLCLGVDYLFGLLTRAVSGFFEFRWWQEHMGDNGGLGPGQLTTTFSRRSVVEDDGDPMNGWTRNERFVPGGR